MWLLIQFSIPILIGNLFQQAYTLADRIIVGRFAGSRSILHAVFHPARAGRCQNAADFSGSVQILRYMLNGAGDSMYSLMNGVVEVIARVAFAIGLTAIPFIGMWGIWLTTGLTWTVTALFALVRYKHGAWKSKKLV